MAAPRAKRSKAVASREASAPAGDRDAKRAALEAQLADEVTWPVREDVEREVPAAALGPAFAHLTRVTVPKDYVV